MLAFAEYVKERRVFDGMYFIGDKNGIEGRKDYLLRGLFDEYRLLSMAKFKGRTPIGMALAGLQTLFTVLRIATFLKFKNFVSLTFGGYTSAPLGIYTKLLFKPLFIHEQNTIPGLGNKFLGNFAERVFIAFPRAARFFPEHKVELTGIPIRAELKRYKNLPRDFVLKSLGWDDKFTVLVLGGSQGAKTLNKLGVWLSQNLPADMRLIHVTGEQHFKEVQALYDINPPKCEVKVFSYLENIGRILRVSDIAVSRAGASTSAELSFFGIPTIFIPYPYAAYDHQFYNAYYYVERGGAYVIREEELEPEEVLRIILNHYRDPLLHKHKKEMMERSFIPDAEKKMLEIILETVGEIPQPF